MSLLGGRLTAGPINTWPGNTKMTGQLDLVSVSVEVGRGEHRGAVAVYVCVLGLGFWVGVRSRGWLERRHQRLLRMIEEHVGAPQDAAGEA